MALIKVLDRRFDAYHEMGLQMAEAYIRGGAVLGNPIMARFDAEAARLADLFSPFLEQSLEKTGLDEFQVVVVNQTIQETVRILQGLMVLWLVMVGGWMGWLIKFSRPSPIQNSARAM
ncbi:MAG TPA: hypothetical protein HPQ00_17160 [Magnetococcales bacterium]|nr:hypothetical protein [Magnetococcales bacterium]